jgi:hypothetical protein
MDSIRVYVPGAKLWFLLGPILFVLAAVIVLFARGNHAWIFSAVTGGLGILAILWGCCGAKRSVEFGERIIIHYGFGQREIAWDEVTFVSCQRADGRLGTGIPFVSIPTENHVVTIRLKEGRAIHCDIEPLRIPAISRMVEKYANLDFQREQERADAETLSNQSFGLLLSTALGLAFFGIGTWFTIAMLDEIVEGSSSSAWPETPGEIQNSYVTSETSTGRRGRSHTLYSVAVQYEYAVDGKNYTGDRFRYSPEKSTNRDEIQAIVAYLAAGTPVRIRYKPDDPSTSVLIPGIGADRYVFFGVLVIGGIAALIFSLVNAGRYLRLRCIMPNT